MGEVETGCTFEFLNWYGPFLELAFSNSGEGVSLLFVFVCWGRFCEAVEIPAYIFHLLKDFITCNEL